MIHKKCKGKLVIDCTEMYKLRSPAIKVTDQGLFPGVIQIDSSKVKSSAKLICSECNKTFSNKEEYMDIVEVCGVCKHEFPPDKIRYISGLFFVCDTCINSNEDNQLLKYFGNMLKGKEFPTLLTILMKK